MKLLGLVLLATCVAGSPLLGSKKCTWGPSYWCSHISHAKECGAVQHCMTTVWQNQIIKVKSDETCTYCMLLVGELRSALQDKATDEDIAKDISNACDLLPAGIDRNVCKGIVTDDLPIVLQMLTSKITPSMACYAVGFCSVPDEPKEAPEVEPKQTSEVTAVAMVDQKAKCDDCMKFFEDVQDTITSNETIDQLKQIIHDSICVNLGSFVSECDDLVNQYLPVFLAFLADQIAPGVVCGALGFCTSDKVPPFEIPIKNIFINRPLIPLRYRSSEECELCKDLVTQIDEFLRDKMTQDKIKYELETVVCAELGSFEALCKQYVDRYLPKIFELLENELDPTTVCETISLCKVPGMKLKSIPALKMTPAKPIVGGILCEVCEEVTQELENLLERNETVKTLEDLVEKICNKLPDETLQKNCDDFVKKYAKGILKFLQLELNPKFICTELGICSSQAQDVVLEKTEPKKVNDDALCSLCKLGVTEVKKIIANMSDKEIMGYLEQACSYLSFIPGNYSALCLQYVETYGPPAIDLLKSSDPAVICGLVQACTTSRSNVPLMTVPIPEDTEVVGPSEECQVCDTVLMIVKELVGENATEDEIKELLEKACTYVPSELTDTCKDIIDRFEPDIIKLLLKNIDPYTICKEIGLCSSSKLQALQPGLMGILSPMDTLPLEGVKTGSSQPVGSEGSCSICKMVLNAVDNLLEQKSSLADIKKALDAVCRDVMPGTIADECVKFVDTYSEVVINYIVLNLDAEAICKEIKLCSAQIRTPSLVHVPLLKNTKGVSKNLKIGSDTGCMICKTVAQFVDGLLKMNATEEEVKKALQTVCTILPAELSEQCKSFVDQYGDLVLQLLAKELDPETVCKTIGLCLERGVNPLAAIVHLIPDSTTAGKGKSKSLASGPLCPICEFVMKEVDNILKGNTSEKEIEAALEKVCSFLPDTIQGECETFVQQYAKEIISMLVDHIDPKEVCTKLGFCSGKVVKLPNAVLKKSDNGPQCALCEFVMEEVDSILKKNATEEEIEAALDKVCSLMPATIEKDCDDFVKQYTAVIVKLLAQQMDPKQVCTAIGLCSAKMAEMSHATQQKGDNSVECVVCEFVMKEVDSLLGQNASEAEIEKVLEKVCSFLPDTISEQCKEFIANYSAEIIELLLERLDPKQVCTALKLCSQEKMFKAAVFPTGPALCGWCKIAVQWLKKEVVANITEEEAKKLLIELCDILPGTVTAQCEDAVKMYVPYILEMLKEDINSSLICMKIGACNSTDTVSIVKQAAQIQATKSKDDGRLYFKPHGQLLGKNECTYGPAFWCASMENAKRCNARQHCELYVWNRN